MGQTSCTLSALMTSATLAWPQVMLFTWGNMPQGGGPTNIDMLQSIPMRQRHWLMSYHQHLNPCPQAKSCTSKSTTMEGGPDDFQACCQVRELGWQCRLCMVGLLKGTWHVHPPPYGKGACPSWQVRHSWCSHSITILCIFTCAVTVCIRSW